MQVNVSDALWLDCSQLVTIDDLVDLSGLTTGEVLELVDVGALAPVDPREAEWAFSADCVVTVRRAVRLRKDLELDVHALALALRLLEQIQALEAEIARLRARHG